MHRCYLLRIQQMAQRFEKPEHSYLPEDSHRFGWITRIHLCECISWQIDRDSRDSSWGQRASGVHGTEQGSGRRRGGFSRVSSLGGGGGGGLRLQRRQTAERQGLEVVRVWYSWLWGSVSGSYGPSETSHCLTHFYRDGRVYCTHFWVEDVRFFFFFNILWVLNLNLMHKYPLCMGMTHEYM